MGLLINYISPQGPRAMRIRRNTVVADAIVVANWSLPHPRSAQEVELHAHLTAGSLPLHNDIDDDYEWVAGVSPVTVFKSSTRLATSRKCKGLG